MKAEAWKSAPQPCVFESRQRVASGEVLPYASVLPCRARMSYIPINSVGILTLLRVLAQHSCSSFTTV